MSTLDCKFTAEESLIEDRSDYRSAINGQGAPLSQSLGKQLAGRPMLAAVGGPGDTVGQNILITAETVQSMIKALKAQDLDEDSIIHG
ncbi:unnamed protein product [Bursaphelenchus xylophilus]|uniref:(pine wood nematode) hypothetical protein n=1 Tax=Bursaphelenchus xylophilus TaxID=6326 RepID=A0A811L6G1_BURXY|nr:unnamed protein product [Bursaphelenchus xylophilus]CAG9113726.1 unnamed protein product [Bursaphelenchus xylophilus]